MKQFYKIIVVLLCIVFFTACNGKEVDKNVDTTDIITQSSKQEEYSSSTNEETTSQAELSHLDLAKEGNPDTVAWLSIPGTDIDNPVMQTSNNEDYLKRNENDKYDIWGSYFADYYSNLTSKDALIQNTVIYGHSKSTENPDGKRFTQLFAIWILIFSKRTPISI